MPQSHYSKSRYYLNPYGDYNGGYNQDDYLQVMPYDNGSSYGLFDGYGGYGSYEGFLDLSKPSMIPLLLVFILIIVVLIFFFRKNN
jgi:hypothetical protein